MRQLTIAKANGQLWKCIVFKNDHKIVNQLVQYAFQVDEYKALPSGQSAHYG